MSERSGGLLRIRVQRWGGAPFHLDRGRSGLHDAARLESRARHDARCATSTRRSPRRRRRTTTTCASGERAAAEARAGARRFRSGATTRASSLWAPARDGERMPVSVVYRKDTPLDGTAPLYQYAYGSYGLSTDPAFSSRAAVAARSRLRLRDRARARRAGAAAGAGTTPGRLGQQVEHVQRFHRRHGSSSSRAATVRATGCSPPAAARAVCWWASIANVAPERYRGLVAHVPFVDIVTTMLDETIPLTTLEYEEWGDPHERAVLRIHALVFAVRQCPRTGLSGDARDDRPVGQPGAVLRAGEVGGETARSEHAATSRCCCTSTSRPATAANPADTSACAKSRGNTASSSASAVTYEQ